MAGTIATASNAASGPASATPIKAGSATPKAKPIRAPKPTKAPRTKKASEKFYIVPGETDWEIWAGTGSATAHMVETIPSPRGVTKYPVKALALPAQEVVSLPLWLATTDKSLISSMVEMQCEKRGLLSRSNHDEAIDFNVVSQQGTESLVLVQRLAPTLSPDISGAEVEQFDLSCRFTPLPSQSLIIWRELGQVSIALTRQKLLVFSATLGEATITDAAISRLFCLLSIANAERWIEGSIEVVLRGNFTPSEEAQLRSSLGLTVRREERPAPWPPATISRLIPRSVLSALQSRRKQAGQRQIILAVIGVYLGIIALWGGYIGWLSIQKRMLAATVLSTSPQVKVLQTTARNWTELQPAINPAYYPIEVLYRCVNALPKEGVRLTLFEQKADRVIITGESQGTAGMRAANTFFENLKASPDLTDFKWNMPAPSNRGELWKFQIEGTRATAHP